MRPRLLAPLLSVLLLVPATTAHAEWIIDAEAGMVYEDNLPRATREADRKSDLALVPALSIGHYFQLTDAMSLLASVDFRGSIYTDYDLLSNLSSTATQRLVLGNDWIEFEARFAGVVHHVRIPVSTVLGIYARETGQGMIFGEEHGTAPPDPSPPSSDAQRKPSLKVVK